MKLTEEDIRIRLAQGLGSQLEIGYHLPDKSEQLKQQILENQEIVLRMKETNQQLIDVKELLELKEKAEYFDEAVEWRNKYQNKMYECEQNQRLRELVEEWNKQLSDSVNFPYNDSWLDTQISDKIDELLDKAKGDKK